MTAAAKRKTTISPRRRIIEAVALIVGATVVVGGLSSIALLIYTEGSREPTTRTIVIPEGSYALIEQGENPLEIPSTWSFLADDTLVLDNKDDVAHTLGSWFVPPNTVRRFDLQPAYGGFFVCSLHPTGAITLDIQPRDYDFKLIAFPTFGFGLSVGIILFIGLTVSRALDGGGDPYRRDEFEDANPLDASAEEQESSQSLGI
ncbi:MAG: hypothetical protein O3B42_06270 [Actinomycetota bacterium]|nr:hypothetical protein [Actinomycetota bacterium]